MKYIPDELNGVRTQFADIAHESWAGWMTFLFNVSVMRDDGCVVIPAGRVARWQKQIRTPYNSLSEDEQASDLIEADKYLSVMQPMLTRRDAWELTYKNMLAGVEGETVGEKINALLDLLSDVLYEACGTPDGNYDSRALSVYADGLRVLAATGRVKITHEVGRRVVAEFVDVESWELRVKS